MMGPKRLLEEESGLGRQLLEFAGSEQPPEASLQRTLSALSVTAAVGASASTAAALTKSAGASVGAASSASTAAIAETIAAAGAVVEGSGAATAAVGGAAAAGGTAAVSGGLASSAAMAALTAKWLGTGAVVGAAAFGATQVELSSSDAVSLSSSATTRATQTAPDRISNGANTRGVHSGQTISATPVRTEEWGRDNAAPSDTPDARSPESAVQRANRVSSRAAAPDLGRAQIAAAERRAAHKSTPQLQPAQALETSLSVPGQLLQAPSLDQPSEAPADRSPLPTEKVDGRLPVNTVKQAAATELRAEVQLIDGARAALRSGQPGRALQLLAQHRASFTRGRLVPERLFLQMKASDQAGNGAAARRTARRILQAYPNGPHAAGAREFLQR